MNPDHLPSAIRYLHSKYRTIRPLRLCIIPTATTYSCVAFVYISSAFTSTSTFITLRITSKQYNNLADISHSNITIPDPRRSAPLGEVVEGTCRSLSRRVPSWRILTFTHPRSPSSLGGHLLPLFHGGPLWMCVWVLSSEKKTKQDTVSLKSPMIRYLCYVLISSLWYCRISTPAVLYNRCLLKNRPAFRPKRLGSHGQLEFERVGR